MVFCFFLYGLANHFDRQLRGTPAVKGGARREAVTFEGEKGERVTFPLFSSSV